MWSACSCIQGYPKISTITVLTLGQPGTVDFFFTCINVPFHLIRWKHLSVHLACNFFYDHICLRLKGKFSFFFSVYLVSLDGCFSTVVTCAQKMFWFFFFLHIERFSDPIVHNKSVLIAQISCGSFFLGWGRLRIAKVQNSEGSAYRRFRTAQTYMVRYDCQICWDWWVCGVWCFQSMIYM